MQRDKVCTLVVHTFENVDLTLFGDGSAKPAGKGQEQYPCRPISSILPDGGPSPAMSRVERVSKHPCARHAPAALRHMHDVEAVGKSDVQSRRAGCEGNPSFLHGDMRVILLVGRDSDGIASGPTRAQVR